VLDQATKRKIDNARDILVGKIPTPNGQVEQITIALIYKFMDDMDKQSEEWGGKVAFFTGEFEKYAWSKIFDPRIGGHELVILYGEAIEKMNHNPNIPQLFRDIFKNAYLPYRDPETLKAFLKQINEFNYDHSEQLGDAFEYLLSVLGSQGEAGQFRTPRHIIDFIVEIVDPKKNETVLDPACGTAGFLISSYRHILKANKELKNGDKLTTDEKNRLMNNFTGHDIAPEMVRLALVNMYLHGFSNPKIYEYDTLTSEERWNETYDVILANPPFMTPKGGIRPHKRFAIQAKRSEVLFVDYIAEHLNPMGRAGVIVPEGIIFQSQTAYKNLRKMLVEDYLWAVVSLPAGVFNPYSGVKTSILLMDRALAKKTDKILFVKIENDGYDLGAQRRPIDKNDLPKALDCIKHYRQVIMNGGEIGDAVFAHAVRKERIAESGDWNLSGERYIGITNSRVSRHKMLKFNDVCTLEYGASLPKKKRKKGEYPVVGSNGIIGWHNKYLIEAPAIVIGRKGSAGEVTFVEKPCFPIDTTYYVKPVVKEIIDMKFLYCALKELDLPALRDGAGIPGLNRNDVYKTRKIPLPPLDVQKAIVAEIDGYRKIIDGARQVVDNYKPIIKIAPDWEMVPLWKVVDFTGGFAFKSKDLSNEKVSDSQLPVVKIGNVMKDGTLSLYDIQYHPYEERFDDYIIKQNDILIAMTGATVGKVAISKNNDLLLNQRVGLFRPKDEKIDVHFICFLLMSEQFYNYCQRTAGGGAQGNISPKQICNYEIPYPPIDTQREIVIQIEAEQEIVNANKKLIEMFEQKIKDKIAEVWGAS